MLNEELIALKEELLKEIRSVESKTNLQIMLKTQELTEKNNKYIEEFNLMMEKSKSLLNSLSSQNHYSDKINDFDNFRKRTESTMITHEIRINNSMKDIQDIQYKVGRDISESLNVPGIIGSSCKYKNLSSYVSSNINEMEKIKNDTENFKKDNKETKKKLEDIIKTAVNLVDSSTSKCIDFSNKQIKKLEESVKKRIDDLNDRIVDFKSMLMTQERIEEINEKVSKNIVSLMYDKNEINDMINNVVNNFGINFDNLKNEFNAQIGNLIKNTEEKLENEIKEDNKEIKDIKMKIGKINQLQTQLLKNNLSLKNLVNNITHNEVYFNNSSKSNLNMNHNSSLGNLHSKQNSNEEEKYSKFRNHESTEKNKAIDSVDDIKNKNLFHRAETIINRERPNKINIDNYQNKKVLTNKKDQSPQNNSINKKEKEKQVSNINKNISEENKNSISDVKNKLDLSNKKNDISFNKIESIKKDINNSPYKTQLNNEKINSKNKKIESKNIKRSSILKKEPQDKKIIIRKPKNQIQNSLSNMVSFSVKSSNNQRILVISADNITNKDKENTENQRNIIKFVGDNFLEKSKNIEDTINRKRGYSLHKLATLGFEEKANEILPNTGKANRNVAYKRKKTNSPIIKNVFHQNYSISNKIKETLNIDTPVKIAPSFGRTGYAFYDKKEEGINNLINKGISNTIKNYNNNKKSEINLGLSPVSKIKVYGNI